MERQRQGEETEDEAKDAADDALWFLAEEVGGHLEEEVTGDAAEAGRQRPGAEDRQERQRQGPEKDGAEPDKTSPPAEAALFAEHQPPGPGDRGQEEEDRGQAEELHEQIGNHRTDDTEDIARGMVGGVAEAWIVDGPGGKACGDSGRQGQKRKTDDGGKIPFDDAAQRTFARHRKRDRFGRTHWPPLAVIEAKP